MITYHEHRSGHKNESSHNKYTSSLHMSKKRTSSDIVTKLRKFLDTCEPIIPEHNSKKKLITHTTMYPPKSYYISESKQDEFFSLYRQYIKEDAKPYLSFIERHHEKMSPIVCDIDLRYDGEDKVPIRYHTEETTKRFVEIFHEEVQKIIALPNRDDIRTYVLERDAPYVSSPKKNSKPIVKDGIHIMIPDVITDYHTQFYLRDRIIERCLEERMFLDGLPLHYPNIPKDESYERKVLSEIIDESVIKTNGWMMYGSCKRGIPAYKLTHVYNLDDKNHTVSEPIEWFRDGNLVEWLSIRKLPSESFKSLRDDTPEGRAAMAAQSHGELRDNKRISRKLASKVTYVEDMMNDKSATDAEEIQNLIDEFSVCSTGHDGSDEDDDDDLQSEIYPDLVKRNLRAIGQLLDALSPQRSIDYNLWIKVLYCVHSIAYSKTSKFKWEYDNDHRELIFRMWCAFSNKCPEKYPGDEKMRSLWNEVRRNEYTIRTLYQWAKEDNPKAFRRISSQSCSSIIMMNDTGSPHAVAVMLREFYGDDFVCSNFEKKSWWYFENHRWRRSDGGVELRTKLSNQMAYIIREQVRYFRDRKEMHTNSIDDQKKEGFFQRVQQNVAETSRMLADTADEKRKRFEKMMMLLEDTTFKRKVMEEAAEVFHDPHFEKMLDTKEHLMGFDNGVYDLDHYIFRPGRPDDYITQTTGWQYRPLNLESSTNDRELLHACLQFWKQVFPIADLMRWMKRVLGVGLHGKTFEERFYIWLGAGGNGKSKLFELIKVTVGDYCQQLDVMYLIGSRKDGGSPAPDLLKCAKARYIPVNEPEAGCYLNQGLIKGMTGQDPQELRTLYQRDTVTVVFQGLLCMLANEMVKLKQGSDGGMKRRTKLVPFPSHFTATPSGPMEFAIDVTLSDKFQAWRPAMFHILVEGLKEYRDHGFGPDPEIVAQETTYYFKVNDSYADFLDEALIPDANNVITSRDLYTVFRMWFRENHPDVRKLPDKSGLEIYMNQRFNRGPNRNAKIWSGYSIAWQPTDDYQVRQNLMSGSGQPSTMMTSDDDV